MVITNPAEQLRGLPGPAEPEYQNKPAAAEPAERQGEMEGGGQEGWREEEEKKKEGGERVSVEVQVGPEMAKTWDLFQLCGAEKKNTVQAAAAAAATTRRGPHQ